MPRKLFSLAAFVSAVLCVLVTGCWVFSFSAPFGQGWHAYWGTSVSESRNRAWIAQHGSLHLLRDDRYVTPSSTAKRNHMYHGGYDPAGRMGLQVAPTRFGFAYINQSGSYRPRTWGPPPITITDVHSQWSFPLWLPAVLLAILPAAWLLPRMRLPMTTSPRSRAIIE
jgi:hypothetical protein